MLVRIELLADRIDRHDAVASEDRLQLLLGHLHALEQRLQCGVAFHLVLRHRTDRHAENVGHLEQVLGEALDGELLRIVDLPVLSHSKVLRVGQRSLEIVIDDLHFLEQLLVLLD